MMIRDLDGMLSHTDPGTPPEVRPARPLSYLYFKNKSMVRSPWSDQKVSVGWATELCPALTETFRSLHGDLHSTGVFMKACTMVQRPL